MNAGGKSRVTAHELEAPRLELRAPVARELCNQPPLPNIDVMRERVRSEPGWRVVELATGHDAMVSAPGELARMLLHCADAR